MAVRLFGCGCHKRLSESRLGIPKEVWWRIRKPFLSADEQISREMQKNKTKSVTSVSKHEIMSKAGGPSEKLTHLHGLTD